MELKQIKQEEFDYIYNQHLDYLESFGSVGCLANLSDTDLRAIIVPKGNDCNRTNDRATIFRYDLTGYYLQRMILKGANLSGLDLSNSDFRDTDLSNANLENCILSGSDMYDANLSGANLLKVKLDKNTLSNTTIGEETVLDPDLDKEYLSGAKLSIHYYLDALLPDKSPSKSEEYYTSLFDEVDPELI